MAQRYYMLITALPPLPHFGDGPRLPIVHERLQRRLVDLPEDDAAELKAIRSLVHWEGQPVRQTEAETLARWLKIVNGVRASLHPALKRWIDRKTLLAGLRARAAGREQPAAPWGPTATAGAVQRNWATQDFGLGESHGWIEKARTHIEDRNWGELQRLIDSDDWRDFGLLADSHPFEFEALVGYVFRWHILSRWAKHDTDAALHKFQSLVTEATSDYHLQWD